MTGRGLLIAVAVAALLGVAPGAAAQPASADVWRSLYAHFVAILNTGSSPIKSGTSVLVMIPRGVVLDPYIDENDAADAALVSALLDRVPKAQWLFEDNGTTVSAVYASILRFGEPAVPPASVNPESLAAARRLLYVDGDPAKGNSDAYSRYLTLKQDYETAQALAATQPDSQALRNRTQTARQRLETLGKQNQIEAALTRVDNANRRTAFDVARAKFAAAVAAGQTPTTGTTPTASSWRDEGGWTQLSFDLTADPASVRALTAAPASPAVWRRMGPSAALPPMPARVAISFDLKRVRSARPWIDSPLLLTRWQWSEQTPTERRVPVSRTTETGALTGVLPCVPTQALLVRNVRIRGTWTRPELRTVWQLARSATELGFGPFSLTGRYAAQTASDSRSYAARPDNTGLYSPEMQIIGFICDPLPTQPVN